MDRRTEFRSLTPAVALTALLWLSGVATGEPNGGKPATNHEAAIEVTPARPATNQSERSIAPARSDRPEPDAPAAQQDDVASDAEPAIPMPISEDAAGDSARSPANEQQPLIDGAAAARDAAHGVTAGRGGPDSDSGEHAIGLMNRAETDADTGESRFGFLSGRESDFVQVIGALAVVVTLLLVFRYVMVRASSVLAGGRPSGVLEVLVRYPVARGQHLSLIKLGRRILLVHQNGSAMSTLSEVNDADEVAALLSRIEAGSSGRDAERFRSLLAQYQREHETTRAGAVTQRHDAPASTRDSRGEIIDLTRSQMGGLRNLFGHSGDKR